MKHKQRKRKAKKAKEHQARQAQRKAEALAEAAQSREGFVRSLEAKGYVPNGRGGWRPIHTVKQTDTISKA
jgi:hypothetical protein